MSEGVRFSSAVLAAVASAATVTVSPVTLQDVLSDIGADLAVLDEQDLRFRVVVLDILIRPVRHAELLLQSFQSPTDDVNQAVLIDTGKPAAVGDRERVVVSFVAIDGLDHRMVSAAFQDCPHLDKKPDDLAIVAFLLGMNLGQIGQAMGSSSIDEHGGPIGVDDRVDQHVVEDFPSSGGFGGQWCVSWLTDQDDLTVLCQRADRQVERRSIGRCGIQIDKGRLPPELPREN